MNLDLQRTWEVLQKLETLGVKATIVLNLNGGTKDVGCKVTMSTEEIERLLAKANDAVPIEALEPEEEQNEPGDDDDPFVSGFYGHHTDS